MSPLNPLRSVLTALVLGGVLSGCGVNPVTGSSEMSFVSEQQEIRTGEQQYGPEPAERGRHVHARSRS